MELEGYFDDNPILGWMVECIKRDSEAIETDIKKLQSLAIAADKILREELEKSNIKYDFAEVRILDRRTVGVQGDQRTYFYPAVIEVRLEGGVIWDVEFTSRLSNRITNEIREINRVTYTFATQERPYKRPLEK